MNNQSNQTLEVVGTRTIDQIRKDGIDKQLKERIAAERAEMQHIKDQVKERLPGQFVSLKQDKETRTFLFTGQWQKIQAPTKDFVTKQEIPGKTVTRYRFQVYDMTTYDPNNPPEAVTKFCQKQSECSKFCQNCRRLHKEHRSKRYQQTPYVPDFQVFS